MRDSAGTNAQREQKLREFFTEAGCTGANLTEQPVKRSKVPNLICTWPGATDSRIVVGAHFDYDNSGGGVIDNWSGASLLPSLLQSVRTSSRRHTFEFVAFTDEEKGEVGSKFYVHELTKEQRARIQAMVNLDSLGADATKVALNRGDEKLVNALGAIANALKLPLSAVDYDKVGTTDSDSFQDQKIPAITVHSITSFTFPILHSSRDRIDSLLLDNYYDSYLLLRAYLAYLDQVLDTTK